MKKWKYPPQGKHAFNVDTTGLHDHQCWACQLDIEPRSQWRYLSSNDLAKRTNSGDKLWMCRGHWKRFKKYRNIDIDPINGIIAIRLSRD